MSALLSKVDAEDAAALEGGINVPRGNISLPRGGISQRGVAVERPVETGGALPPAAKPTPRVDQTISQAMKQADEVDVAGGLAEVRRGGTGIRAKAEKAPTKGAEKAFPMERILTNEGYIQKSPGKWVRPDDPAQGRKYDVIEGSAEEIKVQARKRFAEHYGLGEAGGVYIPGTGEVAEAARKAFKALKSVNLSFFAPGVRVQQISQALAPLYRHLKPEARLRMENETFNKVVFEGMEGEQLSTYHYKEMLNKFDEVTGELTPTNYSKFESLGAVEKEETGRLLLLGDDMGRDFTDAELVAQGFSDDIIQGYKGVREALDNMWLKFAAERAALKKAGMDPDGSINPMPPAYDLNYRPGYFPHDWKGSYELRRADGTKYIKPDGTSSFSTINAANKELRTLIKEQPLEAAGLKADRVTSAGGLPRHFKGRKGELGFESDVSAVVKSYLMDGARWVEMGKFQRGMKKLVREASDLSDTQRTFIKKFIERIAGKPTAVDLAADAALESLEGAVRIEGKLQNAPQIFGWINPKAPGRAALGGIRKVTTHLALGAGNTGGAVLNTTVIANQIYPALSVLSRELGVKGAFNAERYLVDAMRSWSSATGQHAVKVMKDKNWYGAELAETLARAMKLNPEHKALLNEMVHKGVIDMQYMVETLPGASQMSRVEKISMGIFSMSEEYTRAVAAIAAFRLSKAAGLPHHEALRRAFDFTSQTVGRYSPAGRPQAFTGGVGGTLGIFKTFMTVQADNFVRLGVHPFRDPGAFIRYWGASVGMYGVLGAMPGGEFLQNTIGVPVLGVSATRFAYANLPETVTSGLPRAIGMDWSQRGGTGDIVPQRWSDLYGAAVNKVIIPSIKTVIALAEFTGRMAAGDQDATNLLANDMRQVAHMVLPNSVGLKYLLRTDALENVGTDRPNTLFDNRGRPIIREMTAGENWYIALGLPAARELDQRRMVGVNIDIKSAYDERRQMYIGKIMRGEAVSGEVRNRFKINSMTLRRARKAHRQTPLERQQRGLPKRLRQMDEVFEPEAMLR